MNWGLNKQEMCWVVGSIDSLHAVVSTDKSSSGRMSCQGYASCLCWRSGLWMNKTLSKISAFSVFITFFMLILTMKGHNLNANICPSFCCWLFKWLPLHTLISPRPPPFHFSFFIPSSATTIFPVPFSFLSLSRSLSCNEPHAEQRLCN